jgi:hypothetical protein
MRRACLANLADPPSIHRQSVRLRNVSREPARNNLRHWRLPCGLVGRGAAVRVEVWRADGRRAQRPGVGVGAVGQATGWDGPAQYTGLVFMADCPVRDIWDRRDVPSGDQALSDAAVLADGREIGEEVTDEIGVADGAPGEAGRGVGHDGVYATLVAAGAVGDDLAADDGCQLLESVSGGPKA